MSFADCIGRAVDAKETDKARGEAAQELWKAIADDYERMGYSRHNAEQAAGSDVKVVLRRNMQRERHTVLAQLSVMRRNAKLIEGSSDPTELPLRVLEGSTSSKNQMNTVVGQTEALRRQFNGQLSQFLAHHSRNIVGRVRNKVTLKNVVRALHGEGTGDEAAEAMAKAVSDTFERARQLYNSAGGNIGKLDIYGIPHKHSRETIVRAGYDRWAAELAPRLDWTKIENKLTGRPFSPDGAPPPADVQAGFLKEIYKNIESDGWNKRNVSWGQKSGKALSNRHSEARVLHFRSADDWMAYNDKFGDGDPFAAITGHLHGMARDIAMMQNLGPSHTAGLQNMIDNVAKKVAGDLDAENKLRSRAKLANAMLGHISGAANTPVNHFWAKFLGGVRQTMSAAHLGSAMLVSGSDSVAMSLAANSVGMNPANAVSKHMKLLASSATRETAARMGYVADTLADAGATMHRFLGEAPVGKLVENLNGFVMRAQGLAFWTDMGRVAFQMEFSGALADAKTLGDLHPRLAEALQARGITEDDWAIFAREDLHFTTETGERFASPLVFIEEAKAAGIDPKQAERIGQTIDGLAQEFGEVAVPSQSFEMRAWMGGVSEPGTVPGEMARSFLSYKSYAMTFSINQFRQVMAEPTPLSRAKYLAMGMAGFTFMGAVGVQLKELSKGNETREMDTSAFWMAAALQGGGLGILGDLTSASTTRLGGGLLGYVAGPTVGLANELGSLVFGNAKDAINGDNMNLGRDFVKAAKGFTPGSTLWPSRVVTDRWVWDQLQLLLDPEADQAMRRAVSRQKSQNGNGQWWASGELTP